MRRKSIFIVKKICVIISIVVFMGIFSVNDAFCRTYVNAKGITDDDFSNDTEEDDDIEVEPIDEDEEEEGVAEGSEEGSTVEEGSDNEGPGVVEEGIDTQMSVFEKISNIDFWVGWRKYHYNFIQDPFVMKDDDVEFKYRTINTKTKEEKIETGYAKSTGYGLYMFDIRRHMVGLLSYINKNIGKIKEGSGNADYDSTRYDVEMVLNEESGTFDEKVTYWKISALCKEVYDNLIKKNYSNKYIKEEFNKFWEENFKEKSEKKAILTTLQNAFYYKAYAKNAISKLRDMGFPFPSDSSGYKPAIYGMIFSIMEARYRNKDIGGKLDLSLKVAEGDLWPFLIYLNNLEKVERTGNKGNYHYKIDGHEISREDWPSLDEIVDGCYQWMVYYESEFMESTSASTVTSQQMMEEADDDVDSTDWEAEYSELTNGCELPDIPSDFYDRVSIVRSTFKKSSDNQKGIFGADEEYNIESETTLTEAMKDMRECMRNTFGSEVFTGLEQYNIERTYMLAKNIATNERLQSEYSYYDIGINIIDSTPGEKGTEYLLADFQRIKLGKSIRGKDREHNHYDTDGDGLEDGSELGDTREVDVTEFIKKMLLSEYYGKEGVDYQTRDPNNEEVMYLSKDKINEMMTNYKKNLDESRKQFDTEHANDNVQNRSELAEHNLQCTWGAGDTGDYSKAKLKVSLYDYSSNPIFKDTDFDGLSDKEEQDMTSDKLDNSRKGNIHTQSSEIQNANTHMDYRYFFMNNKVYYDELSTMSLMICNAIENEGKGRVGTEDFKDIDTLMHSIGLTKEGNNTEIKEAEDEYGIQGLFKPKKSIVKYVTGIHEIEYSRNAEETPISKKVKLIAIKSIESGYENIEYIGKNDRETEYNVYRRAHIDTFDKLANSIFAKEYAGNDYVYWIVGHGTGGAVANLLSAKIIQNGKVYVKKGGGEEKTMNSTYYTYEGFSGNAYESKVEESKHNEVISNVYAYTFGSPYTIYNNVDSTNIGNSVINGQSSIYCSIYNVMNEDDILCYLPTNYLGFDRYGVQILLNKYSKDEKNERKSTKDIIGSSKDNSSGYSYNTDRSKRQIVENAFYKIFVKNEKRVRDYYYDTNLRIAFSDIIKEYMTTRNFSKIEKWISEDLYKIKDIETIDKLLKFTMLIKNNYDGLKEGGDTGAYYYLSKALLPENITMQVNNDEMKALGGYDTSTLEYNGFMPVSKALEEIGKWYSENVYTYDVYNMNPSINNVEVGWNAYFNQKLSKANQNIKDERNEKIIEYNSKPENQNKLYSDATKTGPEDRKKEIETYKKKYGIHGLYECDKYNNKSFKNILVGDDCSSFTMAVLDYATHGALYNALGNDIYNAGGGSIFGDKKFSKLLTEKLGFEIIPIDNKQNKTTLVSGDLLVGTGHYEFVIIDGEGDNKIYKQYGWGDVYDYYPKNKFNIKYDLKEENHTSHHYSYIIRLPKYKKVGG